MNLLNKELKFGDTQQRLIVKRLDEEYNWLRNIKKLKDQNLSWYQLQLLMDYEQCKKDISNEWNKYYKSLIEVKANNILDEIIRPIITLRKQYIEENFEKVIIEKRNAYMEMLKKKYKTTPVEKFILPF